MTLDAAKITMNMDSSLVHAEALADTTGTLQGKPVYRQGSESYNSEKMSFNFKTKKGQTYTLTSVNGKLVKK